MTLKETISTLESLDRLIARGSCNTEQASSYCIAINEAIKYLHIFEDMFEGARMTSHKENNNEHTNI